MGFRGNAFAFDSPAAAVAGMVARFDSAPTARPTGVVSCDLGAAHDVVGRVLAAPVAADRDSPALDCSSMDGYAVRSADLSRLLTGVPPPGGAAGVRLAVMGEAGVGSEPRVMAREPGVVRIVTGAALPSGADLVVKREDVIEHMRAGAPVSAGVEAVTITSTAAARCRAGDYIRRRGENGRAGQVVLDGGTLLSAAALGLLASVGCSRPLLYPRLRVAIITTGDEIVPPLDTPEPFETRNSNGPAVSAVLAAHTWIDVVSSTHRRDDPGPLAQSLRDALCGADAVILTGGVSMGHRDPVRGAIESVGADIVFHGLPQRPGKPMLGAFVTRADGRPIPVFGLPGNPVSAMVTCARIVVPVLGACAGISRWPAPVRITLANPDARAIDLWWHRLVRLNDKGEAELVDARGSGDIIAVGRSDGFIEVPPRGDATPPAEPIRYPFFPWPT